MTETTALFVRFGAALAVGLLIGIEREREQSGKFAGVRTFPLITLAGCLSAMLSATASAWCFPVAFLVVGAFVLRSYILTGSAIQPGITTEMSALIAFLLGGLTWWGPIGLAAALAVVTVLLLSSKRPLERLARRIGRSEIVAAVQFGVITLIVLPLLPNRTFGPLQVLNPYQIWLMVVLIVGVNLVGYLLVRRFGSRQGYTVAGLLGGLVSSTAAALSFSRRSREQPDAANPLAMAIVIACSIMFLRVLVITLMINVAIARCIALPMAAAAAAGLLAYLVLRRKAGSAAPAARARAVHPRNPFELWPAIQFGVLFGVILFLSRAASLYFGQQGVYLSSALAGMADVDAIVLSLVNLANGSALTPRVAAQGILLAAAMNTAVKGGIVIMLGAPALRRAALPAFVALFLVSVIAAVLI
ncbi:MAG: MgtC/SapB family protein [Kiritimatiellia bacterium]